jgi:hypothetical protein
MFLKSTGVKYGFAANWNGILLCDNLSWRQSEYYELLGEGIATPPQTPWPITLYALSFSLLDSAGHPRTGQFIQLVGLAGKQYPVVLAEGVLSPFDSLHWQGSIPLLYGFGVISGGFESVLSGDMCIVSAAYSERREE